MSTRRKQCRPKPNRSRAVPDLPPVDPLPRASTPEGIGATPDEVAAVLADRAASREPWLCDCDDRRETWARTPDGPVMVVSHRTECRWNDYAATTARADRLP